MSATSGSGLTGSAASFGLILLFSVQPLLLLVRVQPLRVLPSSGHFFEVPYQGQLPSSGQVFFFFFFLGISHWDFYLSMTMSDPGLEKQSGNWNL